MSQPSLVDDQPSVTMDLQPAAPTQKQQINVYTVMLIIALMAISIGCLMLYLELGRWGDFPWWNTGSLGAGISSVIGFLGL